MHVVILSSKGFVQAFFNTQGGVKMITLTLNAAGHEYVKRVILTITNNIDKNISCRLIV